MSNNKEPGNPWTPDDEREHFPSVIEWWGAEAFFKSVEDNKKWSLKASFTEWLTKSKKPGSNLIITLFDLDGDKHFCHYSRKNSAKLETAKDSFNVRYNDSSMKGSYPNYKMYFRDPKNNIDFDIKYSAESLPHWIAQDITNGWLPMSLGFYRYGFIPKCNLSGTMKTKDNIFSIEGRGYFEHVWGNFSYTNPIAYATELKKTISTYSKLIGWWIHNHKTRIPKSIMFCTENNPRGYDWIWALFDNGWSLFYGNILLWIMKGPVAGSLIFSKDGKTYTEFCNVNFQYKETRYVKEYDFYYPSEIIINAQKERERLSLCFKMTVKSREFLMKLTGKRNAFFICEAPGEVKGYYFDGKERIKLSGVCKMEPQRQVSKMGHNSLKLDFMLPPKGVGIDADLNSHYLKKRITTKFHIVPRPSIKLNVKKLKEEDYPS